MHEKLPAIAVVGSGYWGKNLIRNYNELGALKQICDNNESLLSTLKSQYPGVESTLAFSETLLREDIRGVVIATPAETHYLLAKEALLAGKHVYVEKPLVLDERQAEELIDIADRCKLILMVGHLMQYHPAFVKLNALAKEGALGRINYIYSNRLNLGKVRREENILWSFAPHDISMILTLAGEAPESVSASGGCYLHQRIADVTTTHLEFPSGLKAHIFVSWLHPFKEQKLVVVGDRKMAVFNDTLPWSDKLLLYEHRIDWENSMPVLHRADAERVPVATEEPLKKECLHFLQSIATGEKPFTDGLEALRVLKVLNASQQSLDRGGQKLNLAPVARQSVMGAGTDEVFVHQTAVVDMPSTIGPGTKIWHFSHILPHSTIGAHCNIGQNVVIGPDVTIGHRCKIQNNVSVYKGVTLEDGVFCGPSMVFTNIYNPRAEIPKMEHIRPTLVRKGATIGANATIVCGVTLGCYCFIGAGSVVVDHVPDYALMVGNPARRVGWVCQCGVRLTEHFECLTCGKKYKQDHAGVVAPTDA